MCKLTLEANQHLLVASMRQEFPLEKATDGIVHNEYHESAMTRHRLYKSLKRSLYKQIEEDPAHGEIDFGAINTLRDLKNLLGRLMKNNLSR